tara:strand:- start:46 stop:888 length:843 start_codon:yes stop_codon:yes gene_type:complete
MAVSKIVSKGLTKKKKKAPKKKKKVEKVKADAAEKKSPISKRQFKKNYEVDIGKPNPTDRTIRDMPQRKIRGTSGRAADSGSDPIVVGSKSMPSFADVNAASGRAKSALKAKLRKLAEDGNDTAAARLERIEKAEAKAEADRVTKSAIGRSGTKKVPDGTYVHRETGEVIDVDSSDIKIKKLPESVDNYFRNPTPNQMEQVARNLATRRGLKERGEDMESTIDKLYAKLIKKVDREKGVDTKKFRGGGMATAKKSYGTVYRAGGAVKGKAYGSVNNLKRR